MHLGRKARSVAVLFDYLWGREFVGLPDGSVVGRDCSGGDRQLTAKVMTPASKTLCCPCY